MDRTSLGLNVDAELTRRRLLKGAGAGLAAVAGGNVLAACGSSGTSATSSGAASEGKPVAGGVLRVGASGGGPGDTLEAHYVLTNTDYARLAQLYDPLVRLTVPGKPEMVLATEVTPNKTATEWTIKLRKGLRSHDGKPFTAKDVIYSFNRIVKGEYPGLYALGPIDIAQSRALDNLTVLMKFSAPFSIFLESLGAKFEALYMVPIGYNPKKPVGTGPFKLKSFTPGRESVAVKFDEYWDQPKPYLDEVVTININDETAQVNALLSGQVDCIDLLAAGSIGGLESGGKEVTISETAGWQPFAMAVDKPPFSDNRVREALRLSIDRPAMLQSVFGSYGTVGNDYFAPFDEAVKSAGLPQREQDIEKAKSLLKQAGQEDLMVPLITAPLSPGMIQSAQVYSTQVPEAGINSPVVNQGPTEFYARTYGKTPLQGDYSPYYPYLITTTQNTLSNAPFNPTHFNNPKYDKYFEEASRTTDKDIQTELIHEMVKIDWKEGSNCIPYYFPVIDAFAPNVHGIGKTITGEALDNFQFQNFWIT